MALCISAMVGQMGIYMEKIKLAQPHTIFESHFQIDCGLKYEKQIMKTFGSKYVYDLR